MYKGGEDTFENVKQEIAKICIMFTPSKLE